MIPLEFGPHLLEPWSWVPYTCAYVTVNIIRQHIIIITLCFSTSSEVVFITVISLFEFKAICNENIWKSNSEFGNNKNMIFFQWWGPTNFVSIKHGKAIHILALGWESSAMNLCQQTQIIFVNLNQQMLSICFGAQFPDITMEPIHMLERGCFMY